VSRGTRFTVTASAAIVMVASLTLVRVLSGDRGVSAAVQAALFVTFAVAAFTLFVVVVVDFDRWVDTVSPVPKRVFRRWLGRTVRRVCRMVIRLLAFYGGILTRLWLRVGAATGWVLSHSAAAVAWLLASAGRALAWVLARVGEGLTWLWVRLVRAGVWTLVRYRAVVQWLWTSAGRVFAWVLARVGEGLTWLWVGLVRAGGWVLVRYRAGVQSLWTSVAWVLARAGEGLTWLWSSSARAGSWLAFRCGSGISRLWWAAVGGGDEAEKKPLRRMYTSAFDSAFGIPPEGASIDAVGRRRASRRPMPANRPRPQRPTFVRDEGETFDTRGGTRTALETELARDPRRRYVGRQVSRRGQRGKPEDLLAAALARLRGRQHRR
jgi:hypothetical protein